MIHKSYRSSFNLGLCAVLLAAGGAFAEALQDVEYAEKDLSDVRDANSAASAIDLSVWDSEQFQKEFIGSYGMVAEVEPGLTVVESEQMQKVLAAMSDDDDQAKAMKLLEKNLGESSSAMFEFTLANLNFQQEKLEEALALYEEAIAQFPDFRRAYKNAALIYVRGGEYAQAIPYLTKTIELGEHTSMTYGLLGFAYASVENHLCAESAYRQAILLDPATLDWQLGLARSLFKQEKFGDAVSLCNTLIKIQPDNADYWLLQANAFLGLKQPMRAAENYEYVNALGKASAESMTMLADIYVNESRWDMAGDAYLRAYELENGDHPENALRAAGILASRGALNEAKRVLDRVAEHKEALEKKELQEMLKLQARIAVADGGGDDVVKILEEVVDVDPLDGEAWILLGQHYGRNDPEKAIMKYEMAASIEAYEAEAKLYHGQLLVGMAKYNDALPLLRRAYDLKPREDIADYIEQVERIAKTRG